MHSGWQPWPWASRHAQRSSAVHHTASRWWASAGKRAEKHTLFSLIHSPWYVARSPSSNQELLIWWKCTEVQCYMEAHFPDVQEHILNHFASLLAQMVKNLPHCNAGDWGSIPGLGRSPGEGNDYPLQYSCLENSMEREAWQATVPEVAKRHNRVT